MPTNVLQLNTQTKYTHNRLALPYIGLSSLAISLSIVSTVQAQSEIVPVYGIVLAAIASATLGELNGNSVLKTLDSTTAKRQLSFLQGRQDDELSVSRLAMRWEYSLPVWQNTQWRVTSALEASYGYWNIPNRYQPEHNQDIGLTPIFKWQKATYPNLSAESGVGVHGLETTQVRNDNKSTQFQFGDQMGIGWENDQFRIGYRYLHISNANIKLPNPATDFHNIEIGYRF